MDFSILKWYIWLSNVINEYFLFLYKITKRGGFGVSTYKDKKRSYYYLADEAYLIIAPVMPCLRFKWFNLDRGLVKTDPQTWQDTRRLARLGSWTSK